LRSPARHACRGAELLRPAVRAGGWGARRTRPERGRPAHRSSDRRGESAQTDEQQRVSRCCAPPPGWRRTRRPRFREAVELSRRRALSRPSCAAAGDARQCAAWSREPVGAAVDSAYS
jgi:hypothetical protein